MKMYVKGTDVNPDFVKARAAGSPFPADEETRVGWSPMPIWTERTKRDAENQVVELHRMKIHIGDHYCQLKVEQVSEDEFAMVCNNHPQSSK